MPASIRRTIKKWRCHVSNGQNGQQSRMWLVVVVVVVTVAVGEETAVSCSGRGTHRPSRLSLPLKGRVPG